ncbi:MAG TPA: glycosyltransferase, partial [Bacteroidota bacterium]
SSPFVSVIVAARNEERNIQSLLDCLIRQNYSDYEIIIIDDRSNDRTAEIIRSVQTTDKRLSLLSITTADPEMPAKKNALSAGIRTAKGGILVFTDADCRPQSNWIRRMVGAFDDNVGLVAGFSPYDPGMLSAASSFPLYWLFQSFIRYEELKGALWSWGSIEADKGWLCTGRNLAYRKKVWDEVGGFEKIRHSISGDDDLFLQLVRRLTTWKIAYVGAPDSQVPTSPPESFGEFLEQRKRHFSAARYFPFGMKAFFTAFHGSNLLLYCGLIASLFGTPEALWLFGLKSAVDLLFIWIGSARLGTAPPVGSFLFMEIVYVVYNALVGPLGLFGSFKWKPQTT